MLALFKWAVLSTIVFVVILVGVGLFLPSDYQVSRSILIEADRENIHGLVGELTRWPEWAAWQEMDPSLKTVYGEKTTGIGAYQAWNGKSGNGELTFTKCDPESGVAYDLFFAGGRDKSPGAISYDATDNGTNVTWEMSGDFGMNLIGRYYGLMMDRMVGTMFDDGLKRLKKRAEADARRKDRNAAG